MNVLLINKFLYPKGGDAISTLTTGELLTIKGHQVTYWGMDHFENPCYPFQRYFVSNIDYLNNNRPTSWIKASANILYSFEAKKKISVLLDKIKPDIIHLNNFAHQISPSILDAIKRRRIPTVMTMRDYKMVCPVYSLIKNGELCDKCRDGYYYHCFINRCTKGSLLKSLLNTLEMYLHHNVLHIYDQINLYIAPSLFLKHKVENMGLKGEVAYLPNCIKDTAFTPSYKWQGRKIVYVGRLSKEKGIVTLIDAIKDMPNLCLKIIGEGPLKSSLNTKIVSDGINNVDLLGYKSGKELHNEIKESMFIVIPSEWYENNPRTVIEAFALGKPVIGSRIGGIPELVRDWETGLTYEAGNPSDLRTKINLMVKNTDRIREMGKKARTYVETDLNYETHYKQLMKIYNAATEKAKSN